MLRQQILRTSRSLTSRLLDQQLHQIRSFSSSLRPYAEQPAAEPTPDPRDQQIAEMRVLHFEKTSCDDCRKNMQNLKSIAKISKNKVNEN
jgi:hypothetical protein